MTQDEKREQALQSIMGLLSNNPFTFEFQVKKRPKGIRVIYEMTQEDMDAMMEAAADKANG